MIATICRQGVRFLLVGGTATAIDALLYLTLLRVGLDPRLCNAISYPTSGLAAFWMHRHWTFKAGGGRWKGQVLRFCLMVMAGLMLSSAIISISLPLVGPLPAKLLALAGTLILNFSISRWIVFVPDGHHVALGARPVDERHGQRSLRPVPRCRLRGASRRMPIEHGASRRRR